MLKYWKHLAAAFVACLVLVLLAQPAEAVGGQYGAFTYELKGNGTAVITKFDWDKHSGGDVYVPRSIDGYQVTTIGRMAFSSNVIDNKLMGNSPDFTVSRYGGAVAVVLPDTITVIEEKAFFWTAITACDIPANVQIIGPGAFAGCRNIRQFSVNSQNRTFAVIDGVLFNKTKKELVAFPLAYPSGNGTIYTIPTGIKSIGDYAFYGSNYYGNNNDLQLPGTLTSIGDYSFYGAHIDLANAVPSLTQVGDYAFAHCYLKVSFKHVPAYMSPKTIGSYCFLNCHTVDEFPFSLRQTETIGEGAFSGLRFESTAYGSHTFYKSIAMSKITVVPAHAFEDFRFYYDGELTLPTTVVTIEEAAFAKARDLVITIPASVKTIGKGAFSEAVVHSISFADASELRVIEDTAFLNTIFLNSTIDLPDGVETIGYQAFYFNELKSYQHLSMVSIPESVTSIGNQVVNRSHVVLQVTAGSYADIWASENGFPMQVDDTSWLFE